MPLVELLKDHYIYGGIKPRGARLSANPPTARKLLREGLARLVEPRKPGTPPPTSSLRRGGAP